MISTSPKKSANLDKYLPDDKNIAGFPFELIILICGISVVLLMLKKRKNY